MARRFNYFFRSKTRKDSPFSWYVTTLCLLILMLTTSYVSGLGNVFVAIHNSYGVSREEAAIPLNAMLTVGQFTGLISGAVLQRYTARKALFLAILVEFVGAFSQFLSPLESEFTWTSVCMGIRGAGMGVVPPILLQVVSTHFEQHRAKALMLVFLGYSLSGVVLPFIVDHTYETYGLKGSWLIHAAMIAQSFLLVKLVRSRGDYVEEETAKCLVSEDAKSDASVANLEEAKSIKKDGPFMGYRDGIKYVAEKEGFCEILFRLSKNFRAYIIVFSEVVGLSGYFLCNTTLVDYGMDSKLPRKTASVMLVVHGVGELFGKLPTSWLVDKRLIGNELVVGIVMFSSSVLYLLLTFSRGNYFIAVVFFIGLCFGASQVSRIPLFPSLGVNTTALTYGIASCLTGAVVFFLPELIGKYRDEMKDYKYIYFIFGSLLLMASFSHMASHWCHGRKNIPEEAKS